MSSTSQDPDTDDLNGLVLVGRPRGLLRGTAAAAREVWRRRQLLWLLIVREVKSRYNGSYLGVLWSLGRPIVQLLVYYIFIGHVLQAAKSIPDFAIFIFTNLTIWGLFTETVSSGTTSIRSNAGLVKKVYLPREIFPITSLGAAFFNFIVQFVILIIATAVLGVLPLHAGLLYLVPAVLIMAIYGLAIGMALGAINAYLRDTEHLVDIALMLMFWASPILYSLAFMHSALAGTALEAIYLANPATIAIIAMQKAIWISGSADPAQYWPVDLDLRIIVAIVIGLVLLWVSQRIFARLQGNFAQEL